MSEYYKDSRKAAIDLQNWITDNNRGPWSEFVRGTTLRYGFGRLKMERMIRDNYPDFIIVGEKLIDRVN